MNRVKNAGKSTGRILLVPLLWLVKVLLILAALLTMSVLLVLVYDLEDVLSLWQELWDVITGKFAFDGV